ncbi:hypothetical protein GCM10009116_04300 [Brevundimonas basaltis]|uniref:TonB C-terminal domain-containing protein n=1 Tax=Brevundimonas basaltis TaxID=472166 RepID=A0A7W8HZC6_9CAUL|nr:hypothetical protein [Brevundimonas basaltis]MBB5292699.1 hypothetical protein [Brevundimonas basaltis]
MRDVVIAAVLAMISAPALAQDTGDDWDYGEDSARKLSIAAVSFENFGVAVRCMDGNLSVVLSGLPVATGTRKVRYRMGDGEESDGEWISGRDSSSAFTVWPRFVAAGMSRGGRLALSVPDGDGTRQYAVDLPASGASISRVFRNCGHDLEAAIADTAPSREDLGGLVWRRTPEPDFPSRASYDVGLAGITCRVRDNGRLRDCRVESEFPEGSGFGRAATYGAHRTGQVALVDGSTGDMAGRRVSFMVRYQALNWHD